VKVRFCLKTIEFGYQFGYQLPDQLFFLNPQLEPLGLALPLFATDSFRSLVVVLVRGCLTGLSEGSCATVTSGSGVTGEVGLIVSGSGIVSGVG